MIKKDLAEAIARKTGLPETKATEAIDTFLDAIGEAMVRLEVVELRGFGVFKSKMHKAQIGRNPKKPEEIVPIPAQVRVKFKPGKELKDKLRHISVKPQRAILGSA
jgi:nucleoid DNA-binding protein